ncbi:hypothetical protein, partial [Streptomyces violascens]|uniref:hypothetical protein n=1 Tax=Streptomyces violascens TaxID=67381 RepID=UPI0036C0667A
LIIGFLGGPQPRRTPVRKAMQPPHIETSTWWIISILATCMFLLYFVPLMPTRKYKVRIAMAPVAMAVFGVASALGKGIGADVLLPMYASVTLGILLGVLGHGKKMRRMVMEMEKKGEDEPARYSVSLNIQVAISIIAMGVFWFWITHGGSGAS